MSWKHQLPLAFVLETAASWRRQSTLAPTDDMTLDTAAILCGRHQFVIWDALVVAAAVEAGCRLLLSEDMQNGFVWRGLTIANPFAVEPHPLLASLLGG